LKSLLLLITLVVSFTFSSIAVAANDLDTPSNQDMVITMDDDIQLEVVSWGGKGTSLIFLAGLALNAHTYDYFAPNFTDKYRVLGITRAGHGNSEPRVDDFSIARQVKDIIFVLDSLNIQSAIFAGHSFAGAELNYLARHYPNRVKALIYIDALQDLRYMDSHVAVCPDVGTANIDLFKNKAHFYQTQRRKSNDGSDIPFADLKTLGGLLKAEQQAGRNYTGITIPAIAISHIPEQSQDLFLPYGITEVSQECIEEMNKLTYLGVAKFIAQRKNADVAAISHSQHMLHMATPEKLKEIMNTWLEKTFALQPN